MAIKSYFFNAVKQNDTYDRVYNSEDVTSYLDKLVGNGVFATPSTQLQVQVATGMNVNILEGQGWINGHKMINTSVVTLPIDAADVLLNRIDRVVFYVDYSLRAMGIEVKKGTPATTAVAPELTRTSQRYELCLAEISVAKQVASITPAMITDTRGDSSLCGYVASMIEQIDTTTLFQQFQAGFDEWFDEVKDELVTATLIRKYEAVHFTEASSKSVFDIKDYIPQYAYELDILEVRINGLSLTNREYTKDHSTITLNTPITEVGTPIEFVIYKSVDGSDAESIVDLVYQLQTTLNVTRITGAGGGVKLSITDTSASLLQSFIDIGVGVHTIYAVEGVQDAPKVMSCRCLGQMTGSNNGWIFAMTVDGSVYSNYLANGTWQGWKTLYEENPALLYQSINGVFPNAGAIITPSKKLSECRNGWVLNFTGYNTSNNTVRNTFGQTVVIPKRAYGTAADWSGQSMTFGFVYGYNGSNDTISQCVKQFQVYDDRLVSGDYNASGNNKNIVLRSIQEY